MGMGGGRGRKLHGDVSEFGSGFEGLHTVGLFFDHAEVRNGAGSVEETDFEGCMTASRTTVGLASAMF